MPSETAAPSRPMPPAIAYAPPSPLPLTRRPSTPDATLDAALDVAPTPDAPKPDAPKLDGRRTHIVDRALDYVALSEQGLSVSRIARKRRKSSGYVSIALRLGRAISGMEPSELAALRSPRVTWKLAQRIVREDADVVSIRHQLRAALGGFSTHNADGRRNRKGRRIGPDAQRAVGVAWGWDADAFARDPLAFAEAHLRYLAGVQQSVRQRATRAVGARQLERVSVGQGIRTLQRSLAAAQSGAPASGAPSGTSAERHALAVLEILERKLAEAAAEAAALLPARATSPAGSVASPVARPARATARRGDDDLADALAADLDD